MPATIICKTAACIETFAGYNAPNGSSRKCASANTHVAMTWAPGSATRLYVNGRVAARFNVSLLDATIYNSELSAGDVAKLAVARP